jgi:hypothetical protein
MKSAHLQSDSENEYIVRQLISRWRNSFVPNQRNGKRSVVEPTTVRTGLTRTLDGQQSSRIKVQNYKIEENFIVVNKRHASLRRVVLSLTRPASCARNLRRGFWGFIRFNFAVDSLSINTLHIAA